MTDFYSNYYSKICPELLKVVQLGECCDNASLNDCIVYSTNFLKLRSEIKKFNKPFFEYPFINAIGIKLNQGQILKCAKVNVVSFISKQTKVSAQIYTSKKVLGVDEFYKRGIYGEDVVVAVIDTGIKPHLDFLVPQKRIIKFVDLINQKEFPYDDNGHGTFVSSLICGNGILSNKRYSGISPKTKLISIKALEHSGETGAYKILEAMQWVYDNRQRYNIRVVCMSFGSSALDKSDPLVVGAEALWNVGIVVVAAAGNSGPEYQTIKSPGFSSKIITVGGLDDKRLDDGTFDENKFEIATFSSRGPAGNFFKPDVIAPAVNIVGAGVGEEAYTKMSGTSVSTPMIAGICCLILSRNPALNPDQLKIRLVNNCKKISNVKNDEGFGLANFSRFFN